MKKLLLIFLSCGFLSSCASINSDNNKDTSLIYQEYASEQKLEAVNKILLFKLHGWRYLDQKHLILETSPNKPYLLTLKSRCSELKFAHAIATKHSVKGSLSINFDAVYVPEFEQKKCYISTIHKMNKEQANELVELSKSKETAK
ncbi:DUF6491 family protein [Aliikangiella sp. IMCC44359]|uniref:DUF6491 family protein n=1 Tax=Aliikangiella sp. IMCC44359 TaxID=3459125 RepID=UPI00403AE4FB